MLVISINVFARMMTHDLKCIYRYREAPRTHNIHKTSVLGGCLEHEKSWLTLNLLTSSLCFSHRVVMYYL